MQGGGANCKCINGGSNGNSISDGKITVEFTIHSNTDTFTGNTKYYAKKEDVEKLFDEMLGIDQEKYMFYLIEASKMNKVGGVTKYNIKINNPISQSYSKDVIEGSLFETFTIRFNAGIDTTSLTFGMNSAGNSIMYAISFEDETVEIVPTLPNTAKYEYTYKLTLYYRER